ncbi:MAG: DUF5652 family protein [Patescibacteria group bacterium]
MYSLINPQSPWLTLIFIVLAIWTVPWKGWALWKAARAGSKIWFVVLLIVNTVGILDILYIYIFSKKASEKKIEPAA